jgi:hypothetical protein
MERKKRFMSVLCRNSDTVADPPRTELFWKQNPNLNKMEEVRFGDNRHVVTSEWKLAIGSMGGMIAAVVLCLFRLGAIAIFRAGRAGSEFQGSRERLKEKSEVRAHKSKRHGGASINGVS